jgi:hypothetical protein
MATTFAPWALGRRTVFPSEHDDEQPPLSPSPSQPLASPLLTLPPAASASPPATRDVALYLSRRLTHESGVWTLQGLAPHDVFRLTSVAMEGAIDPSAPRWRVVLSERGGGALAVLDSQTRPSTTMAAALPASTVLEAVFSSGDDEGDEGRALHVYGHVLRRYGGGGGQQQQQPPPASGAAAAAAVDWGTGTPRSGEEEEQEGEQRDEDEATPTPDQRDKNKNKKNKNKNKKDRKRKKATEQQRQQEDGEEEGKAEGEAGGDKEPGKEKKENKKKENKKRGQEFKEGLALFAPPPTNKSKPEQA